MKNPILEELWKVKDEIARECGYDLNKLADVLRQRQEESQHKVVDFSDGKTGNPETQN
jgi:hypothetical protein